MGSGVNIENPSQTFDPKMALLVGCARREEVRLRGLGVFAPDRGGATRKTGLSHRERCGRSPAGKEKTRPAPQDRLAPTAKAVSISKPQQRR